MTSRRKRVEDCRTTKEHLFSGTGDNCRRPERLEIHPKTTLELATDYIEVKIPRKGIPRFVLAGNFLGYRLSLSAHCMAKTPPRERSRGLSEPIC